MGSLGGNTVYHMGTLSRASKNRDMARESEKQQQVTIKSFEARETKIIKSICQLNQVEYKKQSPQVVDSAYGTTRSVKKVYL